MKKILIVIDMQNDFITGSLGTPEAQAIVPNVVSVIKNFAKGDIYYTQDTHSRDDYSETLEGQKLPIQHCISGTAGWEIEESVGDELNAKFGEKSIHGPYCVEKITFGSNDLVDNIEFDSDILESITLVGLCTDICVVSNALLLRAAFPNTKIVVYEDCCAGTTPENHQAALTVMKSCQIDIERSVEE